MKRRRFSDIAKTLLSLALGVAILWWLYRKTDMEQLLEIAGGANFGIILLSLPLALLGNYVRALRWKLLLNSLGYRPVRAGIVYATFGNYAVNFLLPRAGDLWRCAVVAKNERIPVEKTIETFLVDKIIDILISVVILIISILLSIDFFADYFSLHPEFIAAITRIFTSFWLYVGIAAIAMVAWLLFTRFKENIIVRKINHFIAVAKHDLLLIARMESKGLLIVYTIVVWLSFFLYFYICFYAFDFTAHLGFTIGWIVFTMSNVGLAVPVQGGVGTWHFMVISSLVVFGVGYEQAGAFAGAVYAVQSVWIILVGIFGILALPHVRRNQKDLERQ